MRTLLEITVYSAVVFAVLLAVRAALGNRMSPALRFGLWLILLVRLMLPVTFESGWHIAWPAPPEHAAQAQTLPATVPTTPNYPVSTMSAPATAYTAVEQSVIGAPANIMRSSVQSPTPNLERIVLWVWLCGAAAGLAYVTLLYVLLRRRIRRNVTEQPISLARLFEQTKVDMGIAHRCGWCASGASVRRHCCSRARCCCPWARSPTWMTRTLSTLYDMS